MAHFSPPPSLHILPSLLLSLHNRTSALLSCGVSLTSCVNAVVRWLLTHSSAAVPTYLWPLALRWLQCDGGLTPVVVMGNLLHYCSTGHNDRDFLHQVCRVYTYYSMVVDLLAVVNI